ncbi:MarR family transcriptional regulator [Sphingomonas koreensis]|nr:MarR family transcriptional regulator [Sphingomonas koreensis]
MSDPFYEFDKFIPRISLGYLLRRATKLSTIRIEAAFDGSDVSFTQWVVLALVSTGTADTCTALARNMDHDSGAMTRLIDQLEERGLVVRTRLEGDRRVSRLTVTDAGHAMVTTLVASVVGVWNEIIEGFEHDEIRQLIATLTKLLARLEQLEDSGAQAS